MAGVLTAFFIFVLFPAIICGFVLFSRYLRYREHLTMLEHGITPPPPLVAPPYMPPGMPPYAPAYPPAAPPRYPNPGGAGRGTLIWGLVLAGVGLGLSLALWPIGFIANGASGGSVKFPLGLGPWMLAGFIPLFVGLALVLGYVIMRPESGHAAQPEPSAAYPQPYVATTPLAAAPPNGTQPEMAETPVAEAAKEESSPPVA